MSTLLGTSVPVFIAVTLILGGGAAFSAGKALAEHWRPVWQVVLYMLLLGLADRFITFALFRGQLLLPTGYLIDTAVLIAIGLLSYRHTQARKMVQQYPWLYELKGPLGWRNKPQR